MKVYVYPADRDGCGHFRMIWPTQALKTAGHDVTLVMPHERDRYLMGVLNARDELVDVHVPEDADAVVLQRISHRHLVAAITIMRAKGVAVIIDIDDDLAAIHPDNPAFYAFHPAHPPMHHNWRNVIEACKLATHVTVSTEALVRHYGSHGNVSVIHNCVPARYLEHPRVDSDVIGWGGSVRSHPNDLQVIGPAIERLTRIGRTFRVVGPGDLVREKLLMTSEPQSTGVLDIIDEWPRELAALGVGIVPLADTRFNRSKSWLKGMEMAALGVPFVASPRFEYHLLSELGAGRLASTPGDWYRSLDRLVRSPRERREVSEAGRAVARKHTIEGNAEWWWNAWTTAVQRQRRETPTAPRHPLGSSARTGLATYGSALGVAPGRVQRRRFGTEALDLPR